MTPDDLVERVAKIYQDAWGIQDHWRAREVIALVRNAALEEAAKVADDNNLWPAWRIAAAIRGMVKD